MRWGRRVVPPLAGIGLCLALLWMHGRIGDLHVDLEVYRFGVEAWWRGDDMYGTLPPVADGPSLDFVYPPIAVVALSPLAILTFAPTVVMLFVVNLLCLGLTLYLVARRFWPSHAALIAMAVVPLTLLLEPIHQTFKFGQVNLLLMALVAADCLSKNSRWPRGIGVGLAAAIKLTPAAFLLFFLIRKDFRAARTAAITALAATAVGFVVDRDASVRYWFGGLAGASDISGVPFRANQSIQAVLVRLGLTPFEVKLTWIALSVVLLAAVLTVMRHAEPTLALILNAAFALLVSPTSWSHHWVWVAPALLVMLAHAAWRLSPGWLLTFALTSALFSLSPFQGLPGFHDVELTWTPWQQLVGALYPLATAALLIGFAVRQFRKPPSMRLPVSTAPGD